LGTFYTWYALVDNFGFSGSAAANGDANTRIWGPISGNTNGSVDATFATRAELTATGQRLSAVQITGSSIVNVANFSGNGSVTITQNGTSVLISGAPASGSSAAELQGDGMDSSAVGFRGVPQVIVSGNITITGSYNGKHLYKQILDATSPTWTFTGNSTLALPIGFVVTTVNDSVTGSINIRITTGDIMVLAGVGAKTGGMTLAVTGSATFLKVAATRWHANGVGLS
jgi:hypothetical protein